MTDTAAMAPPGGILRPPLAGWGNDDLLMTEKARAAAKAADPDAFAVFDWPQLRDLFTVHEDAAKTAKLKTRRLGAFAVFLSGGGAIALPLAAFAPDRVGPAVLLVCVIASVLGGGLAGWHLVQHAAERRWLRHRLYAERLRHFFFHLILEHFDLAAGVVSGDRTFADLEIVRARELASAKAALDRGLSDWWTTLAEDRGHRHLWASGGPRPNLANLEQAAATAAVANPDGARRLLDRLYEQRLIIQSDYTVKSLQKALAAPAGWLVATVFVRRMAILLVPMFTAIAAGFLLDGVLGNPDAAETGRLFLALASSTLASGLTAMLLEKGLGLAEDAERYAEYLASIRDCIDQFDHDGADARDRIRAFFDLEKASYRETRGFYLAHSRDKFFV